MDDQIWDMHMLGPILELQSSEVWSHAVRAHHWIEKCNRPLGTKGAMYWIVPSNLCLMLTLLWPSANGTDTWTLIRIFGRGRAMVNSWVRECILMSHHNCRKIWNIRGKPQRTSKNCQKNSSCNRKTWKTPHSVAPTELMVERPGTPG